MFNNSSFFPHFFLGTDERGCHKVPEKLADSMPGTICICDTELCNSSHGLQASYFVILSLILATRTLFAALLWNKFSFS